MERALEHDTPSVLLRQALDFLRTEQIVRPGLSLSNFLCVSGFVIG